MFKNIVFIIIMASASVASAQFSGLETQHVRARGITYGMPEEGVEICIDSLVDDFCYPAPGELMSDYGMRRGRPHTGVDLRAARGDTIRAAMAGVVRMAKLYSSYGNIVVLRHSNGLETVYSHNTRNLVAPNDSVRAGQAIALAGRTGRATADHLHFEVRAGGEPMDPKLLIDPKNRCLQTGWLYVKSRNGRITAATSQEEVEAEALMAQIEAEKDSVARAKAVAASTNKPAAATTASAYHTVKRGEVLGSIARRYGTSVSRIVSLNKLSSPDRIREGQRLRVK